ncbi:cholesterol 24-hydroxylase-like [Ylistrum balloti]|uniref:cholesterol 24-hydroxylase-like n=1 Tax=Ylistrum balloti TaxID=509963 RepID=UPI0029059261|nr:cholesterol 24-hydroxylase-like [Ylistrum balloti]
MLQFWGEVLIVLLVCCVAYFYWSLYRLHLRYNHLPGPPLDSFIGGNAPSLIKHIKEGGHFFSYVLQNAQKYGRTFRLIIMNQAIVFTTDPTAIKEMVVSNHKKPKQVYGTMGHIFGERFLGDGLLTESDHSRSKDNMLRPKLQHWFQRSQMRKLMSEFNGSADALVRKLSHQSDGHTQINMFNEFNHIALDLIGKVACSEDFETINSDTNPFSRAFRDVFEGIIKNGRNPLMMYNPMNWAYCRSVRKSCSFLRQYCSSMIDERLAAISDNNYVPDDILTHMVRVKEPKTKHDRQILLDNFLTLFLAGQETTSCLLSFCLISLGKHPHILKRLRDEIDRVVGEKPSVEFEDLCEVHYLDMVIQETLRRYPPSAATYRESNHNDVIDGFPIPKETAVCFSMYVLSNQEEYFSDPLEFQPERFSEENRKRIGNYKYFPFSMGPRTCIGKHFAEIESKIILVKFLQWFNFTLVPDQSTDIEEMLLHRPKDGALCTLTLRDR